MQLEPVVDAWDALPSANHETRKRFSKLFIFFGLLTCSPVFAKNNDSVAILADSMVFEEGNDSLRPAAGVKMTLGKSRGLDLFFRAFGQKTNLVAERGSLSGLGYRRQFNGFEDLSGSAGLCYYFQKITLLNTKFSAQTNQNIKKAGIYFSFAYSIISSHHVQLQTHWDGYFFDAGAGSFSLAFGKKQTVGIALGFSL